MNCYVFGAGIVTLSIILLSVFSENNIVGNTKQKIKEKVD